MQLVHWNIGTRATALDRTYMNERHLACAAEEAGLWAQPRFMAPEFGYSRRLELQVLCDEVLSSLIEEQILSIFTFSSAVVVTSQSSK